MATVFAALLPLGCADKTDQLPQPFLSTDSGGIAIANAGTGQIRLYELEGRHQEDIGRMGDGPGEFRWLSDLSVLPGDSIAAFDRRTNRLSVFDPDGELAKVVTFQRPDDEYKMGTFVGLLPNGSYLFARPPQSTYSAPARVTEARDTTVYNTRFGPDGVISNIWHRQEDEILDVRMRNGIRLPYPVHFSPHAIAGLVAGHLVVGNSQSFEVRVFDSEGQLLKIIRRNWTPEPVSVEHRETFTENFSRRFVNRPASERRREMGLFESTTFEETFPAFSRIFPGRPDMIWVENYAAPGTTRQSWDGFRLSDGRWLCNFSVPDRLSIMEFGPDYVLVTWHDDLDIVYLRLYELIIPHD